jgi:hypothetical protein
MTSANYAASAHRYTNTTQPTAVPSTLPLDNADGVSWRAVFAGAVGACALTFVLFTLGTGLGLSALSPWRYEASGAAKLAIPAVAWVIVTQLAASGVGGYMAGRLRARWTRLRDHEVYFRDTAHGLLAWGLSTLIMATLMGAAVSGAVDQANRAAGTAALLASGSSSRDAANNIGAYWADVLLRTDAPTAPSANPAPGALGQSPTMGTTPVVDAATDASLRAQTNRILMHALQTGALGSDDARALAQLVSQRTGLSQADAQARVNTVYSDAKKAVYDASATLKQQADDARKATAYAALWMVVALLAGAFVSAWLATFGGRQRDAAYTAEEI